MDDIAWHDVSIPLRGYGYRAGVGERLGEAIHWPAVTFPGGIVKLAAYAREPLLFGPSPVHPLRRLQPALGGRRGVGEAGGLQTAVWRSGATEPRGASSTWWRTPSLRAATRWSRSAVCAVQPHPPGRGGRRTNGNALRARPGELGRLVRSGLRQGWQYPPLSHPRCGYPDGA